MWCPEEENSVSTYVNGTEEGDFRSFATSRVGQCLVINTSKLAGESLQASFAISYPLDNNATKGMTQKNDRPFHGVF